MPAFFGRRERNRVVIAGDDAAHLAKSLRARPGEEIEVVDPKGFMLTVRLDSVSPVTVEGTVIAERPHRPEPTARVTIAIANLPAPSLDLVLSRCTEAGAFSFVIFEADRSVGRGFKRERSNSICREAAMLAGRSHVPDVAWASSIAPVVVRAENAIMLSREAQQRLSDLPSGNATLLVGPEGGWSPRELKAVDVKASLGPRNLRADTAALVGLVIALSARGA